MVHGKTLRHGDSVQPPGFCKIIAPHLGPWADSGADPVQDMYILVIGPDPNKIGLQYVRRARFRQRGWNERRTW